MSDPQSPFVSDDGYIDDEGVFHPNPYRLIERRFPDMSQETQAGYIPGTGPSIRSRDLTNQDYALDGLKSALPNANAEQLAPFVATAMDLAPVPAQIATHMAGQPWRAGTAVSDAITDPTLANITDAGIQTGMAIPTPAGIGLSLASALGGFGIAAARDIGLTDFVTKAQAAGKSKGGAPAAKAAVAEDEIPGLNGATAEENQQYKYFMRLANQPKNPDISADTRRGWIESAKAIQAAVLARGGDRSKSDQAEYDRAVKNAEAARDKELSRVRRFEDSEIGKLASKSGAITPLAMGAGFGAIQRLAAGPASTFMGKYVAPGLEGWAGAFAGNNLKVASDAFFTDADNPEKAAYQAYARELPPTHPRKREFTDYAGKLQRKNPVREQAGKEFFDEFFPRLGASALEGIPTGVTGANLPEIMSRLSRMKPGQPVPTPRSPLEGGGGSAPARVGGQSPEVPPQNPQGVPPPQWSPPAPVADGTARYSQAFRDPTSKALSSDLDAMAHLYDIAPTKTVRDQIVAEAGRMKKMDLQPLRREYRNTGLDQPSEANLRKRIAETVNSIEALHAQGINPFDSRVRSQILGGAKQLGIVGSAGAAAATGSSDDVRAARIEQAIDDHVLSDDGLLQAVGGNPGKLQTSANRAALARAIKKIGEAYPDLDAGEVRKAVFDMARGRWRKG